MLKDWFALWGRPGEQDALTVEPAAAGKTVSDEAPQLDRLILPRDLRPEAGNPVPGADLVRLLGIQKKKGP